MDLDMDVDTDTDIDIDIDVDRNRNRTSVLPAVYLMSQACCAASLRDPPGTSSVDRQSSTRTARHRWWARAGLVMGQLQQVGVVELVEMGRLSAVSWLVPLVRPALPPSLSSAPSPLPYPPERSPRWRYLLALRRRFLSSRPARPSPDQTNWPSASAPQAVSQRRVPRRNRTARGAAVGAGGVAERHGQGSPDLGSALRPIGSRWTSPRCPIWGVVSAKQNGNAQRRYV